MCVSGMGTGLNALQKQCVRRKLLQFFLLNNLAISADDVSRAAVGMGIPMGIPMGMGMVWVWGL